jgi:superfamily II DNA/RNA helicase
VLVPLARAVGLSVVTIFGGTPQNPQVVALRNRADIVVACPGRPADLIEQGHCHLGDVEISVLDEADHVADLGFLPVVRRLLDATPPEASDCCSPRPSITPSTSWCALPNPASGTCRRPGRRARRDGPPPAYRRAGGSARRCGRPRERQQPVADLHADQARRAEAGPQLTAAHIPAVELHGNLAQNARERNLASFASGAVRVMVATDIAARGIHVDGIDLVIHADSPTEHKAYLHRSERTARAGAAGIVITLQTPAQADDVRA